MLLTTTLGIRYAVGYGESLGYSLQPQVTDNPGFREHVQDVIFHELTAHIGSSLYF